MTKYIYIYIYIIYYALSEHCKHVSLQLIYAYRRA